MKITSHSHWSRDSEAVLYQHKRIRRFLKLLLPVGATAAAAVDLSASGAKAALAMVQTLTKDRVEVKLSNDWSNGGTLTIVLGDLTTAIPKGSYSLTASSKSRNGTLINLGTTPTVTVGNIIGDYVYVESSSTRNGCCTPQKVDPTS